jgi:hypothetical protein
MRNFSTNVLNLLKKGIYGRRALVLFDMPSGRWGFWDDAYDLSYNSDTYVGIPGAFTISPISSMLDLVVNKVDIVFSGLDPTVVTHISNEDYHRRPVYINVAIIDPETSVIVGIIPWFSGILDQLEDREVVGGQSTVTIHLESGNWELGRVGTRTRSDSDQRQIQATDKSFSFVASAVTQQLWWGRSGPVRPE